MKERNSILLNTFSSIGIAAFIFCVVGVIFDPIYNGNFQMTNYLFTKMVLGVVVIGLGFGLPTYIYNNENMSVSIQFLIHMGIGCVVMIVTAFVVGWIPTENGIYAVIGSISGEAFVAILIWMVFYYRQKRLAKQINEQISRLDHFS